MKLLREGLLGLGLGLAGALVVWGVAGWSENLARIVAGLVITALCVLFLAEANG